MYTNDEMIYRIDEALENKDKLHKVGGHMAKVTLKDLKTLISGTEVIDVVRHKCYKTNVPDGSYTVYLLHPSGVTLDICSHIKEDREDSDVRNKIGPSMESHLSIEIDRISYEIFDEKLALAINKVFAKMYKEHERNVISFLKGKTTITVGSNMQKYSNNIVKFSDKE